MNEPGQRAEREAFHQADMLMEELSSLSLPAVYNAFDLERHRISRPTLRIFCARADAVWARAVA